MPEELWTEAPDIAQERGIKTIPMEKKCKKAKWLSGEASQIAVKRREAKSKGEKERCKHLNAEFQGIVRRDKKAFLSDQCKEIEENNRMGKTRDLFKKDLLPQLLDEQSADSSQHSTTSGVTSAAKNHIDQSHVLPKAARIQWSIMVRIQRSSHFDPQQNNSDHV